MADEGILASGAEVLMKTGTGASASASTEVYMNSYLTQAESFINVYCRFNFSDAYAALDADVKGILKEAASNIAATYVIQFDMSGYPSRTIAENMVNILRDAYLRDLSVLRDKKNQDFINGTWF